MKLGELDISKVMLGGVEIEKIFLGTDQVYSGEEPTPTGQCNCQCSGCTTRAITIDEYGKPVCSLTLDMNDPNRVNSNWMLFDDALCECDQEVDYIVNTTEGSISVIDGNGSGSEIAKYYFETDGTDNGDGTYTIDFNGGKIYVNGVDDNCGLYGCFTCGCGEEDPDCSHCGGGECDPCDEGGDCYDPCADPDSPCYDPCDPENECYDPCQCDGTDCPDEEPEE